MSGCHNRSITYNFYKTSEVFKSFGGLFFGGLLLLFQSSFLRRFIFRYPGFPIRERVEILIRPAQAVFEILSELPDRTVLTSHIGKMGHSMRYNHLFYAIGYRTAAFGSGIDYPLKSEARVPQIMRDIFCGRYLQDHMPFGRGRQTFQYYRQHR